MAQAIPRIVIAATQSGSGKTTIVTGLLTALKQRGIAVQSFKVGPDYIDPGYHALASGRVGHNLDTWLVPKEKVAELFAFDSSDTDIAIIEGVMGLYDGGRGGISSTAEIAKLLRAPVVLVIDARSMGASAAAIAQGFRDYDPEVNMAGVILNRLGSDTHEAMIREAMKEIGVRVFGAMRRNDALQMPERHLGLVPVEENKEGEALELMGAEVAKQLDLEAILHVACTADGMETGTGEENLPTPLCRIAVAHDEAFSFYYPASLRELERRGAQLVSFSPLRDASLPKADGLLLGGGFPEMFAAALAKNRAMRASIREAAEKGMPIYAECGGYMYLKEGLTDFSGRTHEMTGVLPGTAAMTERLQMVGYVEAELQEDTVLGRKGMRLRGHEFHFSEETGAQETRRPLRLTKLRNGDAYLAGQSTANVLGSYLHLHFAGCPEAADSFVEACRKWAS